MTIDWSLDAAHHETKQFEKKLMRVKIFQFFQVELFLSPVFCCSFLPYLGFAKIQATVALKDFPFTKSQRYESQGHGEAVDDAVWNLLQSQIPQEALPAATGRVR